MLRVFSLRVFVVKMCTALKAKKGLVFLLSSTFYRHIILSDGLNLLNIKLVINFLSKNHVVYLKMKII